MVDSLDHLQKKLFVRFLANLKEFRIVTLNDYRAVVIL